MAGKYAGLTFEQAVDRYAQTVTSVCVMRLKNYPDAEDCFQNTFLKLFSKSPEFKDLEHLKAWLIRVAINECCTLIRKRSRIIPLDNIKEMPSFTNEDENDISWALMRVAPKYREVLYLHYCEEYKVDEISEILQKNPNTVKTLLKGGREKLKKIYGGDSIE